VSLDLDSIGAGFRLPALASQQVFRQALDAMAHPGRIIEVPCEADLPDGVAPAAGALLLSLLDTDTSLWLSAGLEHAKDYFRFHTGCTSARLPSDGSFLLSSSAQALPRLETLSQGSAEYPDRSASVILQVSHLQSRAGHACGWRLAGPGVQHELWLEVDGPGEDFLEQWACNTARFPRGVDVFLVCGRQMVGLPRTTRLGG
jgi:alpha-D-ribose 1-methylphosphonate 5-triphosphate synthase subunit PhnH